MIESSYFIGSTNHQKGLLMEIQQPMVTESSFSRPSLDSNLRPQELNATLNHGSANDISEFTTYI